MTRPWVWGIDVSTKCLGVGLVNVVTHEVACRRVSWEKPKGDARRLVEMQDAMIGAFAALQRAYPPATIGVEVPMGSHHKRALDSAYAITLLTLARMMPDTDPWPVNIGSWKKWVLGSGRAEQAELRDLLSDVAPGEVDLDKLAGIAIAMFAADIWEPDFDRTRLHPRHQEE